MLLLDTKRLNGDLCLMESLSYIDTEHSFYWKSPNFTLATVKCPQAISDSNRPMALQSQSSMAGQAEKTTFFNPQTITRPLTRDQTRPSTQTKPVYSSSTDDDTASEDPHGPNSIAQSFRQLTERILALDDELQAFLDECRQLGSSPLILAARALREELDQFLRLFYHNARQLSPLVLEPSLLLNRTRHHDIDHGSLPSCLETIAEGFERIRELLHRMHEYTDESADIKSLMQLFANDFKYRANCLNHYRCKQQGNPMCSDNLSSIIAELMSPHIRLYIHSFADEMGEDLDNIVKVFGFFNKYGHSVARQESKLELEQDFRVSTLATLLSAVTATTLQTSLGSQQGGTPISSAVNTFWFCSLVLSIGVALNSMLKWNTSGTHLHHLPLWITIWIRETASIFLTLCIGCFSAGLVLFTFASNQKMYTSILTLVCTAVTSFGLLVVSAWIAYQKWISNVSPRSSPSSTKIVNKGRDRKLSQAMSTKLSLRRSRNGSFSDLSDSFIFSDEPTNHITAQITQNLGSSRAIPGIWNVFRSLFITPDSTAQHQFRDPEIPLPAQQAPSDLKNEQPQNLLRAKASVVTAVHAATKMFWRGTARNVPRMAPPSARALGEVVGTPSVQVTSPFQFAFPSQPQRILKFGRLLGDIYDLEYSPGGFGLAVTSFNHDTQYSTTITYHQTETDTPYSYRHRHSPQGRVSKQVAWSPHDNMLLVRLDQSIDLFQTASQLLLIRTIYRPQSIESAAWCTSSYILSVEGCDIFKLSFDGHVIIKHHFESLLLRDIAVVPGTNLILVVARVMHREMLPMNSRAEKQLILYDMKHQECKSRNPLLDDMRHITIADHISLDRIGFDVLIGHRNNRSPQVWTLIPYRDGFHELKPANVHLHPYREFTGSGHFAGDRHQMISCVGNDGSIHIWDRESRTLIRRIPAQVVRGGRRCVAWSAPRANFMQFATVGANELKIWSATQTDPATLPPSQSSRLPPIIISRVMPPGNSTKNTTVRDSITGETVPSPRSAASVNIFDGPPSDASVPYHRSDTEKPPDIKVEAED